MLSSPHEDRAALDDYIKRLVVLTNGLTIDDFRTRHILAARRTAFRVRVYIVVASVIFFAILFYVLFSATQKSDAAGASHTAVLAAAWGFSLGGLGAVASIFLHILKLVPQMTLKQNDEFEVFGRIVLGCLFSTIFSMTLTAKPLIAFFESLSTKTVEGGPTLLLPFLAGYSITLVLGLLEKAVRAAELTIGIEDRREAGERLMGRRSR